MARALGLRAVDDADRPLEARTGQSFVRRVIGAPSQQETYRKPRVEQRLPASGKRGADILALGWTSPIGGGGDRPVIRREADQCGATAVFLADELPDVQLAALCHLRCPRISQMRIVRPDHNLCGSAAP
jgi:hypothetical protein